MTMILKSIMKNKIIMFTLIFIALAIFLVGGLPLVTIYRQGWEIKSEIVAMDYQDQWGQATFYSEASEQQWDWEWGSSFSVFGASKWQFDVDNPAWGYPDIDVSISDVRVKETPFPYADLEQVYDDWKYTVTYKEYLFDVQVRTIADSFRYADDFWTGNKWEHETACSYEYRMGGDIGGDKIGKAYQGSTYLRFVVHPFGLFDFNNEVEEGYTFNTYWAGIMNAKLESKDMGKVETSGNAPDNENHIGYVRGLPTDGASLNMYADDGSFGRAYSEVPWDANKVLDPDITSVAVIQLPFEIMAGAYENYNPNMFLFRGGIDDLVPIDYYFTATIRVETFIVKEFKADAPPARDPVTPIDPSPLLPPVDYFPVQIPSWLDLYWGYIVVGLIIVAIIFFALWLLGGAGIGVILMSLIRAYKMHNRGILPPFHSSNIELTMQGGNLR